MPNKNFQGVTITALEGTPTVIARLLLDAPAAVHDYRPFRDRFTLREILAHLADFDPIFLDRIKRCASEDMPKLVPRDEAQLAIDNDYERADPPASLQRFTQARLEIVAFLRSLSKDDWDRKGIHAVAGPITIGELVDQVLAHDGYHTRQIAEWLS
jgi:uncharacterized damage-inducible protein DinB